jgi:hypothetical protein
MGRWRERPAAEVRQLMEVGRSGLERFSYWDASVWEGLCLAAPPPPPWRRLLALRRLLF